MSDGHGVVCNVCGWRGHDDGATHECKFQGHHLCHTVKQLHEDIALLLRNAELVDRELRELRAKIK